MLQTIAGKDTDAGPELVPDLHVESMDVRVDDAVIVDQPKLPRAPT